MRAQPAHQCYGLLIALLPLAASANTITVPKGYVATITWTNSKTFTNGAPLTGAVTYKVYNVKNGVTGYYGVYVSPAKITINVPQCIYVTTVVYTPAYLESKPSSQVCMVISP